MILVKLLVLRFKNVFLIMCEADEVVNIDLTVEELISRLKVGKFYRLEKIEIALNNFFKSL